MTQPTDAPDPADRTIVADSFTYPFRGDGIFILIFGAVISLVSYVAGFAPLIGLFVQLGVFAYFCAIYSDIIQSTSTGSDEPPQFPSTSNFMDDLVAPAFCVIVVFLLSLGPAIFAEFAIDRPAGEELSPALRYGTMAIFVLYFPMAMLAVTNCGSIAAASPHIVVPSIFRAGGLYFLIVGILLAVYIGGDLLRGSILGLPWFLRPLVWVVSMYGMMVNGRALGLLYRKKEEDLGWI